MYLAESFVGRDGLVVAVLVLVSGIALRFCYRGARRSAGQRRTHQLRPPVSAASPLGATVDGSPRVGVAAGNTVWATLLGLRRRRRARIERDLPAVIEEVARSLRSGASFHQALVDVAVSAPGPIRGDLVVLTNKVAMGVGLDQALREWAADHAVPGVRLFCGAMTLTMRSGPDSGKALDGLAQSMRDKAVVEQEARALVAQAQLSGVVIAALPVVFLAFSLLVDRGAASFLLATPAGRGCLLAAVGLDAAGFVWMRRLAQSVAT